MNRSESFGTVRRIVGKFTCKLNRSESFILQLKLLVTLGFSFGTTSD